MLGSAKAPPPPAAARGAHAGGGAASATAAAAAQARGGPDQWPSRGPHAGAAAPQPPSSLSYPLSRLLTPAMAAYGGGAGGPGGGGGGGGPKIGHVPGLWGGGAAGAGGLWGAAGRLGPGAGEAGAVAGLGQGMALVRAIGRGLMRAASGTQGYTRAAEKTCGRAGGGCTAWAARLSSGVARPHARSRLACACLSRAGGCPGPVRGPAAQTVLEPEAFLAAGAPDLSLTSPAAALALGLM
jgi:hypothetical protein